MAILFRPQWVWLCDQLYSLIQMQHTQWYAVIMMTSSNGNIFRVTGPLCGEFTGHRGIPAQRPVTRSFDVFLHLCLNIPLSKQSWGWWFETQSHPLWRYCNVLQKQQSFSQILKFQCQITRQMTTIGNEWQAILNGWIYITSFTFQPLHCNSDRPHTDTVMTTIVDKVLS